MFFKTRDIDDTYVKLVEKIKQDIVSTLQKKGVNISMVEIDMRPDNLNVSVSIKEK